MNARQQDGKEMNEDGAENVASREESGRDGEASEESAPKKTLATAVGEIAWLLSQSPTHRHSLFLADIEWLVMPPLTLSQYRLFHADGKPVGVAFWAFVSEVVEQRLSGGGRLSAAEWRSGDRVWLVELVAPFGGQDRMLADLRKTALADRRFCYTRTGTDGKRETVEVSGDDVP